jgi:dUTP pyrophosphatase
MGMSNKVTVKIKKLHPDAVIPKYAHKGDAGFDLVAVEDVIIEPGETKAIPIGLAFEIPVGYEMQIRPRSGLSLKTKLRQSNCIGTIDAEYRGEVKVMFDNTNPPTPQLLYRLNTLNNMHIITDLDVYPLGTYIIRKGDRIAQGVIQKLPDVTFAEVDELSDTKRGTGGFGSSGIRR